MYSGYKWLYIVQVGIEETKKRQRKLEQGKARRQCKKEKKEADVPWQKHPSRSAEATAPCAAVAFLVSFLGCWLDVDEERRPSRRSSSLRTAALRGGGSGVAAFAFPFTFSDFVGWGDPEGGRMRSERREP